MNEKKVFTSNVDKLIGNIERIAEFKKTNILQPITLDVAPTNNCNQNCEFCSVKYRDKSLSLDLETVKECTKYFKSRGILGVELTGGGEPTLWAPLREYIEFCASLNLSIGMITNGINLSKIPQETLAKLTWIRISLNGIDNGWMPDFQIPENVLFSFNYVWHKKTELFVQGPLLKKIMSMYPRARALKIQKDIYGTFSMNRIPEFDDPRIFVTQKEETGIPKKCYMGWLKPHLDADGYIYRCSTSATFNRVFDPQFRIGPYNSVSAYPDADKFDTNVCKRCFFFAQNTFLQQVDEGIEHKEFV